MAALYSLCSQEERELSGAFFERYSAGRGTGGLTAIRGLGEGPGLFTVARASACRVETLSTHLLASMRLAEGVHHVAVSGGIDSWLLAALLKRNGCSVTGWYLESGVPGYCERDAVLRMADAVGVECNFLRVNREDFVEALPDFVAETEMPIYGLHPVSKLLFARALAERGVDEIVTGDGADQVMRWDWDCDLLPLTLTCFQTAGVRLIAPFLSEGVLSLCSAPCTDKAPVRDLARRLGVPEVPKRPQVFPPIEGLDVLQHTTGLLLKHLAAQEVPA